MNSTLTTRVVLGLICLLGLSLTTTTLASSVAPLNSSYAGYTTGDDENDGKHLPVPVRGTKPKKKSLGRGIVVGEIPPLKTLPVRPAYLPIKSTLFNDPIRFTMTASKDSVAVGEEFEITIRAELLPITPSMMFFFEEQKSFSLKMLMPEGFVQTGGNYFDYVGGTLRPENAVQTITLKGQLLVSTKGESCFNLLRSNLNSGPNGLFTWKRNLCIKQSKKGAVARIATTPKNQTDSSRLAAPILMSNLVLTSGPTFTPSSPSACLNGTVDVTASCPSGSGVRWSDGTFGATRPLSIDTYSAKCVDYFSQEESAETSVTIELNSDYPDPPSGTVGDTQCAGSQFTLKALGCESNGYRWYLNNNPIAGQFTDTYRPTLSTSTIYEVDCGNRCYESGYRYSVTGTVKAIPNPPQVSNVEYCQDQTASTLTATGQSGASIKWWTANTGGSYAGGIGTYPCFGIPGFFCNEHPVLPNTSQTGTTTYYVDQTVDGCTSSRVPQTVTIKLGDPTWEWTDEYGCSGSSRTRKKQDTNPCTNRPSEWVVVAECSPSCGGVTGQVNLSRDAAAICGSGTTTIRASGCSGHNHYLYWADNHDLRAADRVVGPGTYTVYCQADCGRTEATVTVAGLQETSQVNLSQDAASVCGGGTTTIRATGCSGSNSYLYWADNYDLRANDRIVGAGTYTVYCQADCGRTQASVTINNLQGTAQVTLSRNAASVCPGVTTTIRASGCSGSNAYLYWADNYDLRTADRVVGAGSYTVYCQADCGRTEATISVGDLQGTSQVNLSQDAASVCGGSTTTIRASGCNGSNSYLYWADNYDLRAADRVVGPGTYTVYCQADCGRTQASVSIGNLQGTAQVSLSRDAAAVCGGSTTTIRASGCSGNNAYLYWSDNHNLRTADRVVGAGTYTVYCQADCGRTESTVSVGTLPNTTQVSLSRDADAVCASQTTTLRVSGCSGNNAYIYWDDNYDLRTAERSVGPGTYKIRCQGDCGQTEATISVGTQTAPSIPSAYQDGSQNRETNIEVCSPNLLGLRADGCSGTVKWYGPSNNLLHTGNPYVTPHLYASTTFYARCVTDCGESTNSNAIQYTLKTPPTVTASNNSGAILPGETLQLNANATPGSTLTWSGPGGWNGSGATPTRSNAQLAMNGVYTVTALLNGCSESSTTHVNITGSSFIGTLEGVDCASNFIGGWMADVNHPDRAFLVTVHIYTVNAQGNEVQVHEGSVTTSVTRPDIRPHGLGIPAGSFNEYGYRYTIPASYRQGRYVMRAFSPNGNELYRYATSYGTNPPTTITYNPANKVCQGTAVNWTANCAAGETVFWRHSGGNTSTESTIGFGTTQPPGVYNYTVQCVKDGCSSAEIPVSITINPLPNAPTHLWTSSNPSLQNGNNATITVCEGGWISFGRDRWMPADVSAGYQGVWRKVGAVPALTWNNGDGDKTISPLTTSDAGQYEYRMTDPNGCVNTGVTTLAVTARPVPPAIHKNGGSTSIMTTFNCGPFTADIRATGCATGETVRWYNATGTFLATGATYQPPLTSSATFYARCARTCDNVLQESINSNPFGANVLPVPAPRINNQLTGSTDLCPNTTVNLTASGGDTYLWNTGSALGQLNSQGTGNYSVTATNSAGCTAVATHTVNALTVPNSTLDVSKPLNCTSNAQLTATGGSAYRFADPNGVVIDQGTNAINVRSGLLVGGTYSATITFTNSCTVVKTITVTADKQDPSAAITSTGQIACPSTAQLTGPAVPAQATYAYSYNWTGTGIPANTNTNRTINPTEAGRYDLTVTNTTNGCTTSGFATVTGAANFPNATITATGSIGCPSTAQLTGPAVPTQATYQYSYKWAGLGIPANTNTNQTINPTVAGTYNLTVTNTSNNCTATSSHEVTGNTNKPTFTFTNSKALNCTQTTTTLNAEITGGTAPYRYQLNAETAITSDDATKSWTNKGAGTYELIVTAGNGCSDTRTLTLTKDETKPTLTINGATVICAGQNTVLTATSNGSLKWDDNSIAAARTITNPAVGTNNYSVTATGSNGCTAVAYPTVTVHAQPNIPSVGSNSSNGQVVTGGKLDLSASISPAIATATFSWNGPHNWTSNEANPSINAVTPALHSGSYTVTVSNNICSASATTSVLIGTPSTPPPSAIALSPTPTAPGKYCQGTTIQLSSGCTSGALSWTQLNNATTYNNSPITHPATSGVGTFTYVADCIANGVRSATVSATFEIVANPTVSLQTNRSEINCVNTNALLTATGGNAYTC
jgi:hypothetical protein